MHYLTVEENQVKVEVIAYTTSCYTNKPIATLRCTYPRYIHSEVMTHRMFSRNSASSRATPSKVIIDQVKYNPVFFEELGINAPGMNAKQVLNEQDAAEFEREWRQAANYIANLAETWTEKYHLHKQVANRILEPFMRTTTIITATEWSNFFNTRLAEGVEPNMHTLARCIYKALDMAKFANPNTYKSINLGSRNVHLPFVEIDEASLSLQEKLYHSVARCARCTILSNVTKARSTLEEDIKLFNRLYNAKPMHASPFEHQAFAEDNQEAQYYNLRGGWYSYRYAIEQALPKCEILKK